MNGAQVLEAIDASVAALQEALANAGENGDLALDEKVKASSTDTTSGFLTDKVTTDQTIEKKLMTPGANETLRFRVVPKNLLSADLDNILVVGSDNKLKVPQATQEEDIVYIAEGTGVFLTGSGTEDDPIVISTNESIQVLRPCFDGLWKDILLQPSGNANVIPVTGQPQYRIRHDGSIEFKGSITYNVAFGAYSTSNRKYTLTIGTIATNCLTPLEQSGVADLKGINYIDIPQAAEDQIVQQYGYIIRKSGNSILLEFQSSFTNATAKSIVVNFDGAISHPNLS